MTIRHAAARSGLPVKTIRYYEEIGLVKPGRAANGYRDYAPADLDRLTFLKRARGLGFSIDDCRRLIALKDDAARPSREVKSIALAHVADIDARIGALQAMRATLTELAAACPGDDRPACAILDGMAAPRTKRERVPNRAIA